MKFKIREGFVCKIITAVAIGEGKFEQQETTAFGGQVVDFDQAVALQHFHKLEPQDESSRAWLEARMVPAPSAEPALPAIGSQELQELATQIARQMLAAQSAALPPAATK